MSEGGNIFDALDAAVDEDAETTPAVSGEKNERASMVYRVPVTLFDDEETGEKYFLLQKNSFPNRSITKLDILYTPKEKAQVKEQVEADHQCPQILLKNITVECHFGDAGADDTTDQDLLTDESFRLSGSKIVAIKMRMYAEQKKAAQEQLVDPACHKVVLNLDMECRLGNRDSKATEETAEEKEVPVSE